MTKQAQRPTPKTRPLPHPLRPQPPRSPSETPDHYELLKIEVFPGTSTKGTLLRSGFGITSSMFERYLLVKGVNHVNVPRGEHHSIGVAEKAIQDSSNMMRCVLADSNVPNIYWDFVKEHAALVNSMITPSVSDKTKTIFEAVWDAIPNIDLVQPVGCFCARLMDNSAREDWKLDPKNQSGVFLGFAHRRNIYGAQILVDKDIITAKQNFSISFSAKR
jgi:hypothetical protein